MHPPSEQQRDNRYFAEKQPIIQERLISSMLYLIIATVITTLMTIFVALDSDGLAENVVRTNWINVICMSLCIVATVYSRYLLNRQKIRESIDVFIISLTIGLSLQCYFNGGIGEAPIVAAPFIIVLTGYIASIWFMLKITIGICCGLIALYVFGVLGVKPPDINVNDPIETFLRFDQLVYCLIVMLLSYQTTKIFVNDYGGILSKLTEDQNKLDYIANHDKLTGLPNRYACEKHFDKFSNAHSRNNGLSHLLLFIDIDNFKNINTRFGHSGGDIALSTVARRLDIVFASDNATVSRIGGDEFIVMLSIVADGISNKLQQAMDYLARPLTIFDETEYVTCSMGVVEVKHEHSSFKEEYLKADLAMNRAKKTGKNRFCRFDQSITDSAFKTIAIGAGLHEALEKDQFVLFYQAQVDLVSGKVIGAEALIRWQKDGQLIPPNDFIPIAEKNGSIMPITEWVISQSCQDCAKWHKLGFDDLTISINIPSMMLAKGGLPELIKAACLHSKLDPKFLEIELTESVLLENGSKINSQLNELRKMGVSLAIDDFGTGYSNLGYLSQLNVQKLKVDKCFVTGLLESPHNQAIIQAVVHIASSFGMKTVIEGVEEQSIVPTLQHLDCTIGQGYLWSKPVCFNDFMTFVSVQKSHNSVELGLVTA